MTKSFFENPEQYLATAAKILLHDGKYKAANVLAVSTFELSDTISYKKVYYEGFESEVREHNCDLILSVNSDIYVQINDEITQIEGQVESAVSKTLRGRNFNDDHEIYYFNNVVVSVLNLSDTNWRSEIRKALSLGSVSNQGRVRSDNIAPHEHQGLLFRSPPEIELFEALKRTGVLFAPLPTFIKNSHGSRVEPDFIIFKDGISLLIEVDGRSYHRESPVDAQNRLLAFTGEGVDSFRVDASRLSDPDSADVVAKEILSYVEKRKSLRR